MGLSKKNTVIAIPLLYSGKSPEGIPCLPAGVQRDNLHPPVLPGKPCFADCFIRLPLWGFAHSQ